MGGVDIDMAKVKASGTGDYGGVTPIEIGASWVDSTGKTLNHIHVHNAFLETPGGSSGNTGYGYNSETWAGSNYTAYNVDTANAGYNVPYSWQYALTASHDRSLSNRYFAIRGDAVSGNQQPGDIIQGRPGAQKTIRTNSAGTLQVRNNADTLTFLSVAETGLVSTPYGFATQSGPDIPQGTAGYPGQFYISLNYIYICVGANQWRRVALSNF